MSTAPSWKAQRLSTLEAQAKARRENKLRSFVAYPKQTDFFERGAIYRERLFLGGNQTGKSTTGAYEAAVHLTGLYEPWWGGKRFDHPVRGWAAGEGGLLVRDVSQQKLCGTPGSEQDYGTGFIPKSALIGRAAGHGVADLYDTIRVRHASGGVSTLRFLSYDQGRTKFQGDTVDFIWCDEEPDEEIYSECLARLTGDGILWATLTPLKGYTPLINRYLRDGSPEARRDRTCVRQGLKDAAHFTEEEKQRRLSGYPSHERAARENGDPMLGSGAVFDVPEQNITTRLSLGDVPPHWFKVWGIDLGVAHPFGAVLLAHDRDADCVYVLHTIRMSGQTPVVHAAAMKRVAHDVPVAYPHDAEAREKGSGETLAAMYKREGLKTLPKHAHFPDGSISTEAGIMAMLERMRTGRFKVSAHLSDWFEEYRSYHRKDGMLVKINDDLMSATRIGIMALRSAKQAILGSFDPASPLYKRQRPQHTEPAEWSWNWLMTGRG